MNLLNKKEIEKKVISIFAIILNVEEKKLNMKSSPDNTSEWDSLNHIKIIMELENTFNLEVLPEESIEIFTIEDACSILEKKLN